MLDKDKLILVYYFGCKSMSKHKAMVTLYEIKGMLIRIFDESVKVIVIPQLQSYETKLEFININNETLDEDKLLRFENAVQELTENINKFVEIK